MSRVGGDSFGHDGNIKGKRCELEGGISPSFSYRDHMCREYDSQLLVWLVANSEEPRNEKLKLSATVSNRRTAYGHVYVLLLIDCTCGAEMYVSKAPLTAVYPIVNEPFWARIVAGTSSGNKMRSNKRAERSFDRLCTT